MKGLGLGLGLGDVNSAEGSAGSGLVPVDFEPFNMLLGQDDMLIGAYSSFQERVDPTGAQIGDGKAYTTNGTDVLGLLNLLDDHPDHPAYAQRSGPLLHEGDPNYLQDQGDAVNGLRALTPPPGLAAFYATLDLGGLVDDDPYTMVHFFVNTQSNTMFHIMEYANGSIYGANRGSGFYRGMVGTSFTFGNTSYPYSPIGRDPDGDNSGLPLVWAQGTVRGPFQGDIAQSAQGLFAELLPVSDDKTVGFNPGSDPVKFLLRQYGAANARWLGCVLTKRDPITSGDKEWIEAYTAWMYQAAGRSGLIYSGSPWETSAPQTVDMTSEAQIPSVHLAYNSLDLSTHSAYTDPITGAVSAIDPVVGDIQATQVVGSEQMTSDLTTRFNGTYVLRSGGQSGSESGNRSFTFDGLLLNPAVNDFTVVAGVANGSGSSGSVASFTTADTSSNRWMRFNGGELTYRATNPDGSSSLEVTPGITPVFDPATFYLAAWSAPQGNSDTLGCFNCLNGAAAEVTNSPHGAVWDEVYAGAEFRAIYSNGNANQWCSWTLLLCLPDHPDFDRLHYVLAAQRNQTDVLAAGSGAALKYGTHAPQALVGTTISHTQLAFEFDQTEFTPGEFV